MKLEIIDKMVGHMGRLLIPLAQKYIRYFPFQIWKKELFAFFFWRRRQFTTRTHFGAKMKVTSNDFVQGYIYYFGVWEPNLTHFVTNRLTKNKTRTFIDVGANIGYFSLTWCNLSHGRKGRCNRSISKYLQ